MFNKLASEVGLLNKCSCLAADLDVNKFITIRAMNLVTLVKSNLDVQQTGLREQRPVC
jgi:hypothetical protein